MFRKECGHEGNGTKALGEALHQLLVVDSNTLFDTIAFMIYLIVHMFHAYISSSGFYFSRNHVRLLEMAKGVAPKL